MEALVCSRLAEEQGAARVDGGGDPAPLDLPGELAADLARSLLLEEGEEAAGEEAVGEEVEGEEAEAADRGGESDSSSDGGGKGE